MNADHELSRETLHALLQDAIALKRTELIQAVPWLAIALVALAVSFFNGPTDVVVVPAAMVSVWVGGLAREWWRLRRADPNGNWRRDQRDREEDVARREALVAHRAQIAAVTPVVTLVLIGVLCGIAAVEFVWVGVVRTVDVAALVKPAVRAGEWWRLVTAAFLHGSMVHLVGNMSALFVLGSIFETYDSRLRMPLVYLAAVLGCSLASTLMNTESSLGASGGILGLAGYLLVSSYARPAASTATASARLIRKHMLAILTGTAVLGVVSAQRIDNAGHVGGVVAGMLVAALVGKSRRWPSAARVFNALGWGAAAVLAGAAFLTLIRLVAVGES